MQISTIIGIRSISITKISSDWPSPPPIGTRDEAALSRTNLTITKAILLPPLLPIPLSLLPSTSRECKRNHPAAISRGPAVEAEGGGETGAGTTAPATGTG